MVQAVCCSYDTDVFEVRNPLIVNWDGLRKQVNRMGIAEFIRLGFKSSIEDWLLCDMAGACRYLKLKSVPKALRGADGCAKLNELYAKVGRVYQKGYQAKGLVEALDMGMIREKNKAALKELEGALYEYLSSLRDKPFIDTRSDVQKLESAGFDKKTSFRNVK